MVIQFGVDNEDIIAAKMKCRPEVSKNREPAPCLLKFAYEFCPEADCTKCGTYQNWLSRYADTL